MSTSLRADMPRYSLRGGDKFTLGLITEHVATAQLRAAVVGLLDEAA